MTGLHGSPYPPPAAAAPATEEAGDWLPLPAEFYRRETRAVARDLLGRMLVHRSPSGDIGGMIVETEAYGPDDPANHAFRGQTSRNAAMFGPPGRAYVYRIYGVHWCLNAVTGPPGTGEAVLIRALEPRFGLDRMMRNRNVTAPRLLCSGPGRLCQALGIDGSCNHGDLAVGPVVIGGDAPPDLGIAATTRVGLTRAADLPWRFIVVGSPYVSRR